MLMMTANIVTYTAHIITLYGIDVYLHAIKENKNCTYIGIVFKIVFDVGKLEHTCTRN